MEYYDETMSSNLDDHSEFSVQQSTVFQPPESQLPEVHFAYTNSQPVLVPFNEAVPLHSGIAPDHHVGLQSQ